jgi:hypothetical protein
MSRELSLIPIGPDASVAAISGRNVTHRDL